MEGMAGDTRMRQGKDQPPEAPGTVTEDELTDSLLDSLD
jgi:hypothetical protein